MEVDGNQKKEFCSQHSSRCIFVQKKKSYMFGTAWRGVNNNHRIHFFGWTMPLTSSLRGPFMSKPCCVFISRRSSSDILVLELLSAAWHQSDCRFGFVPSCLALASVKHCWVRSETVRSTHTQKQWHLGWEMLPLNLSRFRHYSVMVWRILPLPFLELLHNELSCRCECLSWIWNCAIENQREARIEPSCFLPQSLNPIAFPEPEMPLRFAECRIPASNAALTALNRITPRRYLWCSIRKRSAVW